MPGTTTDQPDLEFVAYFWSFYGPEGVNPLEGPTMEQAIRVCWKVQMQDPEWCGGDTDDVISAYRLAHAMFGLESGNVWPPPIP